MEWANIFIHMLTRKYNNFSLPAKTPHLGEKIMNVAQVCFWTDMFGTAIQLNLRFYYTLREAKNFF